MFRSLKRSRDDSDDSHPLDSKKVRPWQDTSTSISTTIPILEQPDTDQTIRFRAPTLTPIDSSDEEDNSKHALQTATITKLSHSKPSPLHPNHPKLLLAADDLSPWQRQPSNQPSPIPHALIHHSLDISESALTAPAFGHDESDSAPRLSAAAPPPQPDTMMEDVPQKIHLPAIRLPSPVSDTDMAMTDSIPEPQLQTVDDYPYRVPTPGLDYGTVSPIPVAAHPMSRHASRQNTPTPPCPIPHRRSALVMGYRADCDKCRCKVPGHYSHIVQRA
ncbi:uncharacterized protein N7469_000766 [Penicillium citrinum]|uniref:Uncharacterized protein n=2 Tax=Penicillium TaxID=5073 RepID=A0A9W9TVQ1_PENCI|nr:uncharacterized protein N7469_000766 [Penicillium citrinum]KAJ5242439.1 hypothetical protein N7469_000766 [Penicillium citrinum]KAJ5600060.1 hypothetical protein N7450_001127 [Penicillium hetheringtonii]